MKQSQIFAVIAAFSAMLILAGCSKDNVSGPGPAQGDVEAMKSMIENSDSVAAYSKSEEFSIDDLKRVYGLDYETHAAHTFPKPSATD
jgi:hypothetical protein